ncbi:MAG: cupin domain-containing protein [Planctomycetota bacterium]|nr:cupin domain-containing protein [Planctomycetota bacterium]
MNRHEFLDDDLRELAALYVLDSLESEAARRYRLHLRGCEACQSEVESLARLTGRLTHAAPEIAPPPELWTRVLERIRGGTPPRSTPSRRPTQVWKDWDAPSAPGDDGVYFALASAGGFEATGLDGVAVRRLAVDPEKERVTMLVRMAPGTSYPAHRHGGAEECFVLEGDLRVGDVHMQGGDFQRAESGSVHPVQSTDSGCLLLIVSSTTDELLD